MEARDVALLILLLLLLSFSSGCASAENGGPVASTPARPSPSTQKQPPPGPLEPGPGLVGPNGRVDGNLVQNWSFESDFFNSDFGERRRFLLLQASDLGMGEQDGKSDYWCAVRAKVKGKGRQQPGKADWEAFVSRDGAAVRTGSFSLRLTEPVRVQQRLRMAAEQARKAGGAHYAASLPLRAELAAGLEQRPVTVGAWCKAEGAESSAKLVVLAECGTRVPEEDPRGKKSRRKLQKLERVANFSAGAHDWEYRSLELKPEELPGPIVFLTIGLQHSGGGTVWFDDVTCVEPTGLASEPMNGGFEKPGGWSDPRLWRWFRNDYYTWTGWTHGKSLSVRGGAALDRSLAYDGAASLRLTVHPGDNFAVISDPIRLNQKEPELLEVRAVVKADSLKTFEIMARDERDSWLPQGDFLGDALEFNGSSYDMGSTAVGTYDWFTVRKYFSPDRPVSELKLYLCARGFDGKLVPQKNVVGTVWIDNVQLIRHGASARSGGSVAPTSKTPLLDVQLGDRMWGLNVMRLLASARHQVTASLIAPNGRASALDPQFEKKSDGRWEIAVPYRLEELCRSSEEQYRLRLTLDGSSLPDFVLGTPSKAITSGLSGYYFYPGERPFAYANLRVARDSLDELQACRLAVTRNGKPFREESFPTQKALETRRAADYIDTTRLLGLELESLKPHPWGRPQRDLQFHASLLTRSGAELAAPPLNFGFMEPLPPPEPLGGIRSTGVDARGYLTVNDEGYFPVYWIPHFSTKDLETNYPPTKLGFEALDLTNVVYGDGSGPGPDTKAKLQQAVKESRSNPRLFEYRLGDGEHQLQGPGWQQRAKWLGEAAEWIRQADPDHLINGPESWLIGHPNHNQAMTHFIPHLDVIGVEASYEQVPKIREFAKPLMKEKATAILVGLETYYYQPLEVLRWRGYLSLIEGAAGVGLCPSGMLTARPDKVNFLRGLNGEFRGLAPFILASEPSLKTSCDSQAIELFEREREGRRLLVALPARGARAPGEVTFTLPGGYSKLGDRAEQRKLSLEGRRFRDSFPTSFTVRVYEVE